jgi:ATP phosphoribosyltransferase regulatory subunit HisZ
MATDSDHLLREAEDQIEAWLCDLDGTWRTTLADAVDRAERIRAAAAADAAELVAIARVEAELILADAHATAGEHADVIRALTTAEREVVGEELESLREAVSRLRSELSNLVDAAFDALPAVEATAEAIDRALGDEEAVEPEPELVTVGAPAPKRGRLRRIFRRS